MAMSIDELIEFAEARMIMATEDEAEFATATAMEANAAATLALVRLLQQMTSTGTDYSGADMRVLRTEVMR